MAKIKAVSVAVAKDGAILVVDQKGRLWIRSQATPSLRGTWAIVDLPDEPKEDNHE